MLITVPMLTRRYTLLAISERSAQCGGNIDFGKEQNNMKFELKLSVLRRKGRANRKMIAPFINGWNVWNIPEKHWTEDVQNAIKNAYLLGCNQVIAQIKKELDVPLGALTGDWGDVKDVT